MALGLNHIQVRSIQMNWVRPAQLASAESTAPATGTMLFAVLLSVFMCAQIVSSVVGASPLSSELGLRSEIWSWSDPVGYGRTVTYALLHVDAQHFIGNVMVLLLVGSVVEWRLGIRVIGPLLLVGAVVAALTHILIFPSEARTLIGASGVVSTLFGAATIVAGDVGIRIRLPRSYWLSLTLRRLIILWLLFQVAGLVMVYLDPSNPSSVAYWAHLAGFGVGLIAGVIVWKRRQTQTSPALSGASSHAGD